MNKSSTKLTISRLGAIAAMAVIAAVALPSEPVDKTNTQDRKREVKREAVPQRKFTREDYVRIEAELKKLVKEGKISKEDMAKRLERVRKAMTSKSDAAPQRQISREEIAKVEAELRKLVAAGKISEEDARKRLEGMMRQIASRKVSTAPVRMVDGKSPQRVEVRKRLEDQLAANSKMSRADIERLGIEIRKLVTAGKVSEENASKAMAILMGPGSDRAPAVMRLHATADFTTKGNVVRRVQSGRGGDVIDINKNELIIIGEEGSNAEKHVMRVEGNMQGNISREMIERVTAELRKLVESGKLSPQDMRKHLGELTGRTDREIIRRGGGDENVFIVRGGDEDVNWVRKGDDRNVERMISREEIVKVGTELRKLVAAGTITEADARKRMEGLMQRNQGENVVRVRAGDRVTDRNVKTDVIRKRAASGRNAVAATRTRQVATGRAAQRGISREQAGKIVAELREAVAAGKVSKEDARKRLGRLRGRMAGEDRKTKGKRQQENKEMSWSEFVRSIIK